ncbi:MAG: hypothetical protein NTU53_05530 [Planctomycetota bacterium]|nr:hypothetical protein [Planctomycetota bacterium]
MKQRLFQNRLTPHFPIRHDAHLLDPKTRPQALHDRQQCLHIRRVPRPHLAADRPSLAAEHHAHHYLLEVRAVVLVVSTLADALATFSLEVEAGGVEERQREAGEQVAPPGKQRLLDLVLGAAR